MKFIKNILFALIMIIISSFISACSGSVYNDGVYTAQAAEFPASGWKEIMEITIENGQLVQIDWDAVYKDESIPIRKKQYSKSGLYGMMAGGAISEWYDQATAAEHFVLEHGIDALNVKQDAHTDVVAGCTIKVSEFDILLRECLEKAKK